MGILAAGIFFHFVLLTQRTDLSASEVAAAWEGPVVVEAEGGVLDPPRAYGNERWSAALRLSRLSLPGWSGPIAVKVMLEGRGELPAVGSLLRVQGTFFKVPPARNPGSFDRAGWLAEKGIFSVLRVSAATDIQVIGHPQWWSPDTLAGKTKAWIVARLSDGLDPASVQAGMIRALTIGETGPLNEQLVEAFRQTGTFHLFSVSGLHVAMLAVLLWVVMGVARVPRRWAAGMMIPALFFYALVTGWSAAGVRAATMAAFVLGGIVLGRPASVLNSLLAAAFFLLLADCRQLFNAGFQLSFGVVLALVLATTQVSDAIRRPLGVDPFIPPRIYTPLERMRGRAAMGFASLAAVSIVAWLASMPLIAGLFRIVSLSSLPANMICVPLSFVSMALAVLALVAGPFSLGLTAIFNNANWLIVSVMTWVVVLFAGLPFSYVPVPGGPHPPRVTVLDLGEGAAVLIEAAGKTWLVDAGSARDARATVVPLLRSRGIGRLDGLVLTHGDAAHVGGASAVVHAFRPELVVTSPLDDRSPTRKKALAELEARKIAKRLVEAGDVLTLAEGLSLRILHPARGMHSENADDKALALLLDLEGWRILLMSDAGLTTETFLAGKLGGEPQCHVLVRGRHYSDLPILRQLLAAARPLLVIAPGSTRTGGPSASHGLGTAGAVEDSGAMLLEQSAHGAITLVLEGGTLHVRSFLGGASHVWHRVDGADGGR
jgi:ComEC/Rec2-related protein